MSRAVVAPVQGRRRSGEVKAPVAETRRRRTPSGGWSHAKQAAEKSPGGEFIL